MFYEIPPPHVCFAANWFGRWDTNRKPAICNWGKGSEKMICAHGNWLLVSRRTFQDVFLYARWASVCTLVKKQSSLVGISSRRERLRGSRELFSGTRPSGPLVVESRLSVLVGPQTLWEKKLPLSLARSPTQGHYSREIRGYASTAEPRQQLPPVLSILVNSQDPMLLIAPRKWWK